MRIAAGPREQPAGCSKDAIKAPGCTVVVAARLGASRSAIYKLIEGGEIPSFRVGRLLRVEEHSLVRYIRRKGV